MMKSDFRRPIALLALLFGAMGLGLLDGQTFTHAVFGLIAGIVAVGCGLGSARKDYADEGRRWLGRIMAGAGVVLALVCIVRLPSAYRVQKKFNAMSKKAHEIRERTPTPTTAPKPQPAQDGTARGQG
jgi:hypothetical protein